MIFNKIKVYIRIARFDHWIKQLFILPGSFVALFLCRQYFHIINCEQILINIMLGLLATCFIASANYVINEYLDAEFDKFHPTKKYRPLVDKNVKFYNVFFEYICLLIFGITISCYLSKYIVFLELLLAVMGVIYNVNPLRSKDVAYIDVLSESFNMAIRLLIGWFLITDTFFPPISIVLGYWMAGAFLMAIKRFAEYRMIGDKSIAALYRKSFKFYTEESLLISAFFYAMLSVFFSGIFLVKYRIEFILIIPYLCALFCYYFKLSFNTDSSVQKPEKLFKEKFLITYVLLFCVLSIILLFIDIPTLGIFLDNNLISVKR